MEQKTKTWHQHCVFVCYFAQEQDRPYKGLSILDCRTLSTLSTSAVIFIYWQAAACLAVLLLLQALPEVGNHGSDRDSEKRLNICLIFS